MSESLTAAIARLSNQKRFRELNWEGSFDEYLDIVKNDPRVARSSFQRVHDMVLSYGRSEYIDSKKKVVHYPFFDDPIDNGRDAIFGLDIPLMRLVTVL
jgi:serine protein kinase